MELKSAFVPINDSRAEILSFGGSVEAAVSRVLSSGWFILGEEVRAFEQELAAYFSVKHAVGVASGTEALQIALLGLGVGPGDEVITVPNTAVATVSAIEMTGAKPAFVDIDPVSYLMDPAGLEAAITPRTKAVIPVHLYGQSAPMDEILAISRRHGLKVVEDACQAHGAQYQGRYAGSFGDAACFSFYPSKNLAAVGDGGMIVTNDSELDGRLRLIRQYGWEGSKRDNSVVKGVNSRLDELQAAVLRVKLPSLAARNEARRVRAKRYLSALEGSHFVLPVELEPARTVWHLFVVRMNERDRFRAWMTDQGVGTAVHYPTPIYLQPAYADLGLGSGLCPVSELAQTQIVTLPLYPELTFTDQDRVIDAALRFPA